MVVEIRPEDVASGQFELETSELKAHYDDIVKGDVMQSPLAIMALQEEIERQTWLNGGRTQVAPAQRMLDFVKGCLSSDLPKSSYSPGVIASPLHFWMPTFISSRLREGLDKFGRNARGFLTNEAMLIASETRTSSPVRIPRDRELLVHPTVARLYPCGEGAGFAGGIVSAAMDGERCAEALARQCFGIG